MLNRKQMRVDTPFDFSKHATIGCGGFSALAVYPRTVDELCALASVFRADKTPFQVLGCMANVLPPDGWTETVVIRTTQMKAIEPRRGFFAAGVTGAELISYCRENGLGGVEFLFGIPCTLGGALYMNAGVAGAYIADIVERVLVLRGKELLSLPKPVCGYAYKKSIFMENEDVILGAFLHLPKRDKSVFEKNIEYYRNRRVGLPKGKSMGCIFKNPTGVSAGKLIDGAGLKGLRIGGAVVSDAHANFIVNDRGATAEEIRELISVMKNAVFAQYKIALEEEISYLR